MELAHRQVHRDHPEIQPRVQPGPRLAACLAQHPGADRHDQAGLLRERDEAVWTHQPFARRLPAQQGLGAHRTAFQAHQRLVVDLQLAALQRPAQPHLDLHALADCGRERAGIEAEAVATARLGLVQRRIGVLDEPRCGVAVVRVQADADARADDHLLPVGNAEGLLHPLRELAGDAGGRVGRLEVLDHDQKLVPAQARERVLVAQAAAQAGRDRLDQLVARGVPQAVVDVLEAVEIDEQHADPAAVAARLLDRMLQPRLHQQPVRQVGQRVVVRQMLELLLRAL